MRIAICDDVQKELETIRTALDTYAKEHPELYFDIDEYRTAVDILNAVEEKTYDIALLDICMPDVLGTKVAEEMLAKALDTNIIFLTMSDEYAVTAFALNATHYLLKPFTQEQFNMALDRAVKKTEVQDFLSLACVDGSMYRVRTSEIVSMETQNHYLLVNLFSGGTLRLRMKLSRMFEELQKYPEFIRVGASYIANLNFVRMISGNTLEMYNGAKIPVPRRSSKEVQKEYMEFCRKEAWK